MTSHHGIDGATSRGAQPVGPPRDLDLAALEQTARRKIGEMAYAYYSGGDSDERLVQENIEAWRTHRFLPRVLVDVGVIDTTTTILGQSLTTPIGVAPTAMHGLAHEQAEIASAQGAARAGALFVLSSLSTTPLEAVAAAGGGSPQWMQLYVFRDRKRTEALLDRICDAGFAAIALTVDAPVSGLRTRELRGGVVLPSHLSLPNLVDETTAKAQGEGFMAVVTKEFDPTLTFDDISWLAARARIPIVVKGVARPDDARRCIAAGASGVIVSNHGARQLDGGCPTAHLLAPVLDAVNGEAPVFVDGGLRNPQDVARALSLGADAVFLGRPVLWALGAGGPDGVADLLGTMTNELRRTMALLGAPTIAALTPDLIAAPR